MVYKNDVDYLGGITSSMPLLISDDVPSHWSRSPEIEHWQSEKEKVEPSLTHSFKNFIFIRTFHGTHFEAFNTFK